MNGQETFDAWKTQRSQADATAAFTNRVMVRVRREATQTGRLALLTRSIVARPWAKTAAVIAGTLLGLARIIVTLHLILFA